MAVKEYLDKDGLTTLWNKIKNTFALISHTHAKSDITDFAHTHGNITNAGGISTSNSQTIGTGDRIVIADSSDSNKIVTTSITFDGSTATKALTQKGTFETFNNYSHPTTTAKSAAAVKVGNDTLGHVVIGSALTASDVGAVPTSRKVDGVELSSDAIHYGTASVNSAGVASVLCTGFSLVNGARIIVRFTSNVASTNGSLKLQVNSQTAKEVKTHQNDGGAMPASASIFNNNHVYSFVYDSTEDCFWFIGDIDTKTELANTFTYIKVGTKTIEADAQADTLEFVAGNNVTLTPDTANDKITIAATDTTYESKAAASGGTAVSLVTTGEKYIWNNKASTDSPTFTGTPKSSNPAENDDSQRIATTHYVQTAIVNAKTGVAKFKGVVNGASGTTDALATWDDYEIGDYWVVGTIPSGSSGIFAGETCEPGDMIYCVVNWTEDMQYSPDHFAVVQRNLDISRIPDADINALS